MVVRIRPRKLTARPRPKPLVDALPAVQSPPVGAVPPPLPAQHVLPRLHAEARRASYEDTLESQDSWLRRNTAFAVSLVVHLCLLIALALWSITEPVEPEQIVLSTDPPLPEIEEVVQIEAPAAHIPDVDEVLSAAGGDLSDLATSLDAVQVGEASTESDQELGLARELVSTDDLLQAIGGGQSGGGGRGGIGPGLGAGNMMQFVERLQRAGAKGGDVQVSLIWDNFNDLDLHVVTPRGENIFFAHRRSRDRGELDVDMNAGHGMTREPVENIYWAKGKAPLGKFKVFVHHYRNHGDPDPTDFEVRIIVDGQTKVLHGYTSFGEPRQLVFEFERTALSRNSANLSSTSPKDEFPIIGSRTAE